MAQDERFLQRGPHQDLFHTYTPSEGEGERGLFGDMVSRAVRELKYLPEVRSQRELPEDFVYLLNRESRILVTVSRRRAGASTADLIDRRAKLHPFGFFTEVSELDRRGYPTHTIGDPFRIPLGVYERIGVTDDPKTEDEPKGVIPTVFDNTRATLSQLVSEHVPLLPSPGGAGE